MQYVDTSVLVAYFVNEAHSAQAEQAMRDTSRYPLAISEWTETEFISALGIKCRTGQLNEEQSLAVQAQFAAIAGRLTLLQITGDDFRLAAELLKDWRGGLRSGDALHLSVAIRHGARLLSLDDKLMQAAQRLGVAASSWASPGN